MCLTSISYIRQKKKKAYFALTSLSKLFHSSKSMWYIVYFTDIYFLISLNSFLMILIWALKVETNVEQLVCLIKIFEGSGGCL